MASTCRSTPSALVDRGESGSAVIRQRNHEARTTTVMMLPNASRPGGNPFVGLLVESLDRDITTTPFTWARALVGRYDVFHAHWPEYLVRASNPIERLLRVLLLRLVVVRCRALKRPIVLTVHNRRAHETAVGAAARAFSWFVDVADHRVFLNVFDSTEPYFRAGDVVIPHGDYFSAMGSHVTEEQLPRESSRILTFGALRAYKGIEPLIDIVRSVPGIHLEVAGRPADEGYASSLRDRVGGSENISLEIGEIPDGVLASKIRRAALIVLPYPNLYNSGAALLALTMRRCLLIPESPTAHELKQEFGSDRVLTYSPPLDARILTSAVRVANEVPEVSPGTLNRRRQWETIGSDYSQLFRGELKDEANAHG